MKMFLRRYYYKLIGGLLFTAFIFLIWFILIVSACDNQELMKGRATVYSLNGKTAMGTPVRLGVCASGNKDLLGKTIIVYQRKSDDTIGDCLGIYSVEDTGCKKDVIDIWCPKELQKPIINKTWENGCNGRIYIQITEVSK